MQSINVSAPQSLAASGSGRARTPRYEDDDALVVVDRTDDMEWPSPAAQQPDLLDDVKRRHPVAEREGG